MIMQGVHLICNEDLNTTKYRFFKYPLPPNHGLIQKKSFKQVLHFVLKSYVSREGQSFNLKKSF